MKLTTDFLVIGSGISGLSIIYYLSKILPKTNILLLTKEALQESSTYHAQGGIACVWNNNDDFEKHIQDTVIAGDGLCE
ncbi:MAG: FAD-binding protein, partial [Promethearchaeota archaeon]